MAPSNTNTTNTFVKIAAAIILGTIAFAIEIASENQNLGAAMYLVCVPFIWFVHNNTYRIFMAFVVTGLIVLGKLFSDSGIEGLVWQQMLDRGAAIAVVWLVVFIGVSSESDDYVAPEEVKKPPRRSVEDVTLSVAKEGRGQGSITQSVFNELPDANIIFDFNGAILAANPKTTALFGHSEAALKGQDLSILASDAEPKGRSTLRALLSRKDPVQLGNPGHFTGRREDGSTFPMHVTVGELSRSETDVRLYVGVIKDYSTLASEEGKNLDAQRIAIRERAGRLTASVVHDLRRALTKTQNYLDLIAEETQRNPSLEQQIGPAMQALGDANATSNKILQFGHTKMPMPESLDLNKVIEASLDDLKVITGGQVNFELDLVGRIWSIRVDRLSFEEALKNLVSNAADALPDRRGTITLATGKIEITAEESRKLRNLPIGDYTVLTVEDKGRGMESNVSAQAHLPYFVGAEKEGQPGLGMSEVFDFVKRCGGFTDIYSEPGKGVMVRLFFPIEKSLTKGDEAQASTLGPVARKNRLSGIIPGKEIILYVDRDDEQRVAVAKLLNTTGFQVLLATNMQQALDKLYEHQDISVVITNEILDGQYNGLQVLAEARELYEDIHAVLATTGAMDFEWPANVGRLQKPFRKQDIVHVIREQIRSKSS